MQLAEALAQADLPDGGAVLLDVQSPLTSPALPNNAGFAFQMSDRRYVIALWQQEQVASAHDGCIILK